MRDSIDQSHGLHREKVKSESRKVVVVQVESNQEVMG